MRALRVALTLEARPVPLRAWDDGSIRVGGTRVTLETVLSVFNAGASPDEIVRRFDALKLADVYAVVAYYLDNREAVDAYLRERERLGDEARKESERRFPERRDLRARLRARQAQMGGAPKA